MVRAAVFVLPLLLLPVPAQAPTVAPGPVDDEALVAGIEARCQELRQQGGLRTIASLREGVEPGKPCELRLLPARTGRLEPPDLYERTRRSVLIVGHYHSCAECETWHFSAATGFALTGDGAVATSWHLLLDDPDMPDALLAAADLQGNVFPVQRVLAADPGSDVCVLQIAAQDLVPLPLREGVRTGEAVWCLSHPDHQFGVFTGGAVARWYLAREAPGVEDGAGAAPSARAPVPFLHVTTEFAGGSSGAPVLDACGNAVGIAQSTTTMVHDTAAEQPDVQMVLRTAAPAAALRALVREPKARAAR